MLLALEARELKGTNSISVLGHNDSAYGLKAARSNVSAPIQLSKVKPYWVEEEEKNMRFLHKNSRPKSYKEFLLDWLKDSILVDPNMTGIWPLSHSRASTAISRS